jgi:hypothetical protein
MEQVLQSHRELQLSCTFISVAIVGIPIYAASIAVLGLPSCFDDKKLMWHLFVIFEIPLRSTKSMENNTICQPGCLSYPFLVSFKQIVHPQ